MNWPHELWMPHSSLLFFLYSSCILDIFGLLPERFNFPLKLLPYHQQFLKIIMGVGGELIKKKFFKFAILVIVFIQE